MVTINTSTTMRADCGPPAHIALTVNKNHAGNHQNPKDHGHKRQRIQPVLSTFGAEALAR
jgi:hypothetical protein